MKGEFGLEENPASVFLDLFGSKSKQASENHGLAIIVTTITITIIIINIIAITLVLFPQPDEW